MKWVGSSGIEFCYRSKSLEKIIVDVLRNEVETELAVSVAEGS